MNIISIDRLREHRQKLRAILAERAEFQADWRTMKAEEYPEDQFRNLRSASCLSRLANSLQRLPINNPALLAYVACIDNGAEDLVNEEDARFRVYGFHAEEHANAEAFVWDIVNSVIKSRVLSR